MASRDLRVTLIGEDKTSAAFGSAGKNADSIGSKFASFGKAAAIGLAGAAGGFALFAKSGVDAFARVEDATGAAGVQFGSASADVVSFSQKAAKSFGLSTGAALDAANTFGTMGKAAGLTGTDLAKFSTDFTGLAGDLASFKGTSPEQAIEAVGAALRGETEPIRAYGVLLDDASMRQEALALGLIKTTKEALTPQQKVLAAQSLIYKQTSDAQGDFERTSSSTANTAKRLAAETENASARLGQQLAPAVTAARQAFLGLIQGASGLVDKIGPWVAHLQLAFSAFFAALREGDVTSDGLVGAFERVGDTLHTIGLVVIPAAIAAFQTIGGAIRSVVGFFQQHDTAARALGAVVVGVMAVVTAAWVAQATVSTINAAKSVVAWFATATASTTSATIQSRSTAQIVVGWLAGSAAAALNAARVVAGWVLMGVQSMIQAARMAAAWLIAMGPVGWVIAAVIGLAALVIANWDRIRAWTVSAWSAVMSFIGTAWNWIKGVVAAGIGFLVNLFLNFTGPGLIIKHWSSIVDFTRSAWASVTRFVSDAWRSIQVAVANGIGSVVSFVSGLPGRMLGALGSLGSLLYGAGGDLLAGLARGIAGAVGRVVEAARNAAKAAVNAVKGFLGIASPSKVFAALGTNVGEGFVQGIAGMQPAVTAQMRELADTSALSSLGQLGTGSAVGMGAGTGPGMGSVGSSASGGVGGSDLVAALITALNNRPTIGQVITERNETGAELAERLVFKARTAGG